MDIEALRTMRDVLQYAGISEAARRSYRSQQTVSKRIASLERELGAQLIWREPTVSPTPAGRTFMRYVDDILTTYDQMVSHIHEVASKPARTFRMHRYGTNTFGRIAAGLSEAIVREQQNVELTWVTLNEDDATLIREGAIDAGFVHAIERDGVPMLDRQDDMEYVPLRSVAFPLSFVVGEGNPALQLDRPSLADLARFKIKIPSFASKGAVVRAVENLLTALAVPYTFSMVYCESNIGYFAACDDSGLTLHDGRGVSSFSPGGEGQGFRTVEPHDADYRFTSYAVYARDNGNPCLGYMVDKIREVDCGLLGAPATTSPCRADHPGA